MPVQLNMVPVGYLNINFFNIVVLLIIIHVIVLLLIHVVVLLLLILLLDRLSRSFCNTDFSAVYAVWIVGSNSTRSVLSMSLESRCHASFTQLNIVSLEGAQGFPAGVRSVALAGSCMELES